MKRVTLALLCRADSPDLGERYAALVEAHGLVEIPLPDLDESDPPDDRACTPGQLLARLRRSYGGIRLLAQMTGNSQPRVWILLEVDGYAYYGDATPLLRAEAD